MSNKTGWSRLKGRLSSTTIASRATQHIRIPDTILNLVRSVSDRNASQLLPQDDGLSDHQAAKKWYNSLWAGGREEAKTSVSQFKDLSLMGAITKYCTSERYKNALLGVGGIGICIAGSAYTAVEVAQATAEFINSLAETANPNSPHTIYDTADSAKNLGQYLLLQWGLSVGMNALNRHVSRDMSVWMMTQFEDVMFSDPEILMRVQHNRDPNSDAPDSLKHVPGDVITESTNRAAFGSLQLMTYGVNTVITTAALTLAMINNALPIEMLRPLGYAIADNGTLYASLGVLGGYLGGSYVIGDRLRRGIQDRQSALITDDIAYRQSIEESISRAALSAQTGSSEFFEEKSSKSLFRLAQSWTKMNFEQIKFGAFQSMQNILGQNGVSYIPSVMALAGDGGKPTADVTFQGVMETSSYLGQLMGVLSEFINMLPEIAEMGAHRERVSDLATLFDLAKDKKEFYALSGIHDFDDKKFCELESSAIEVQNLDLMHRGQSEAFLNVSEITVNKRDWVHVRGKSGAGKSFY
ncbi:MAG: hypothetical protein AAF569_00880 [Pseudomonadota bacterium]